MRKPASVIYHVRNLPAIVVPKNWRGFDVLGTQVTRENRHQSVAGHGSAYKSLF